MLSLKTNQKSLFKQSKAIMYRLGSVKYRLDFKKAENENQHLSNLTNNITF